MSLPRRLPLILAAAGLLLVLMGSAAAASPRYTVVRGDSLYVLSQRFGIGTGDLIIANGLRSADLQVGQVLRIPGLPYTVRPGESLFLLARHHGTTVEALMRVNGLRSDWIAAGQVLWLPGLTHTVQPGESLFLLARLYGTTVAALTSLNGLASHQIMVGQVLRVPRQGAHSVEPGDSLFTLARRFNTTVESLMVLNRLTSDHIEVGRLLAVPGGGISGGAVAAPKFALTAEELQLLAQMINAEAGGEPYLGKVAVGAVILNRVRSPHFPNTVRAVLFQPGQFCPIRVGSFWWTPGPDSVRAARDAAAGQDPSLGALYFYNPKTATNQWIRTRPILIRIGNHVFTR